MWSETLIMKDLCAGRILSWLPRRSQYRINPLVLLYFNQTADIGNLNSQVLENHAVILT
jgi:hypothetical protein